MRFLVLALTIVLAGLTAVPALAQTETPEGEQLIYSFRPDGEMNYQIYLSSPDASDQGLPLAASVGHDAWGSKVSPDGKTVAYVDRNTGFIWTMGLDGSQLTQITGSTPAASCNWSGDGATIYFWAKPVNRLAAFYRVVLETGVIEPLFNGQTYWSWFNDGGFEVFTWTNQETGETFDFIQFGANQLGGQGKCDILQLRVSLEAAGFTALFGGLGDLFTPSRGAVDNRLLIQADHDRAGSHRVYLIQADGTTVAMTDLFSGNPAWNRDQSSFAYIQAPSSNWGLTAYQGSLWVKGVEAGATAVLINSTGAAARPSFFTPTAEEPTE